MSSTDEEPTFETYIGDLLNFMRYCKIWQADTFSRGKNIFVALAVGIFLTSNVALITATLIDFKNAGNDLTSFASYVGPLSLHYTGLVKWSYCIWKARDIAQIVETLKRCHCLSMRTNKSDTGWRKYKIEMKRARLHYLRFLYGWLWLCSYGIFHWCSNPIILEFKENGFARKTFFNDDNCTDTRSRYLPYHGWQPWDVDNNFGYICLFFVQFVGGLSSAVGTGIYDVFYISLLMMTRAHLRYLNDSLIDPRDANVILRFLNSLEVFASPAMFVQCCESIIVLCLVSLEASTVEVNTNLMTIIKLWSMLEYFLCVIIQLFVYSFYATEIRTLGLQIADSVYMCSWEHVVFSDTRSNDKRAIRRINFIIQMFVIRSQRTILLTGGPFYVLSLESYKAIVGVALSNSLILRQVVEDGA